MQPSRNCRDVFNAEQRMRKLKLASRSYHFKNDDPDFTELCFSGPRASLHVPSGSVGTSYGGELKRGSIYQSSKTIRKMKNQGIPESRLLLWPECISENSSMSFISCREETKPCELQRKVGVDSSSMPQKAPRASRMNPNRNAKSSQDFHDTIGHSFQTCSKILGSPSMGKASSQGGFLEIHFHSDEREHWRGVTERRQGENVMQTEGRSLDKTATSCRDQQSALKTNIRTFTDKCQRGVNECEYSAMFSNTAVQNLEEKETSSRDEKSALRTIKNAVPDSTSILLSPGEKYTVSNLPCDLSKIESQGCLNAQVSTSQRISDPLMNSKSSHNQSPASTKLIKSSHPAVINKNSFLKKSLLKEFSKAEQTISSESEVHALSADQYPVSASSPAHLHGCLKMACKHGAPYFEFTLKDLKSSFAAKSCKTDNASNWLYTFHSATSKRKSGGNLGRKDGHKESPVVGQMKVSCNLSSRTRNSGSLDTYIMTEFVLFDSTRPWKTFAVTEGGNHSPGRHCSQHVHKSSETTFAPGMVMRSPSQGHEKHGSVHPLNFVSPCHPEKVDNDGNGTTLSCSWMPLDSQSQLQIAAMVVEVALNKKENSKGEMGNEVSAASQSADAVLDNDGSQMTVIIPGGIHGLAANEETGPSPILERWRSGGGCDCGGWDMACPVVIFDTQRTNNPIGCPFGRNHQQLELFAQGRKEKIPALTVAIVDKGLYSVDFHAQLSSLQAFAICVAVLHSSEISIPAGKENIQQKLHSNSLKALLEEDVKCFIGKIAPEGRRKTSKRMDLQTTFVLDPPISPIGRV